MIANGSSYDLYVNDHLLAKAGDATFLDEMRFDFFVRAANENGFSSFMIF